MGYSRNAAVARKVLPHLVPLARGESTSWTVEYGKAEAWAYKVREALSIIADNLTDPDFAPFAKHINQFKIIVTSPSNVQAQLAPTTATPQAMQRIATAPSPSFGGQEAIAGRSTRTLVSPRSTFDVIEFWRSQQPTSDMLSITEINFTNAEIDEIARFLGAQARRWMVIHPRGTAMLTLAPDDPRVPAESRVLPRAATTPGMILRETSGKLVSADALPPGPNDPEPEEEPKP